MSVFVNFKFISKTPQNYLYKLTQEKILSIIFLLILCKSGESSMKKFKLLTIFLILNLIIAMTFNRLVYSEGDLPKTLLNYKTFHDDTYS